MTSLDRGGIIPLPLVVLPHHQGLCVLYLRFPILLCEYNLFHLLSLQTLHEFSHAVCRELVLNARISKDTPNRGSIDKPALSIYVMSSYQKWY